MIDPGAVGSYTDLATFVMVTFLVLARLRPRQSTIAAGLVAVAERRDDVDDDRLRDELGVDDTEVDALRPTIVCGGEDTDG